MCKKEYLTTKEAAEFLSVTPKQMLTLSSDRKVTKYKLGRLNRYKINDLRELLESNKIPMEEKDGNKTRSED